MYFIMVSQHVRFAGPLGMHMRPAQIMVTELGRYDSAVTILFDEKTINAKSIMSLMASCIRRGSELEIRCEGDDEAEALAAAVRLGNSGLGDL